MKKNTDDTYIDIPETYSRRKLNAMYREIPLKDTTSRLLRKYFNAMANLYGVIPLRKAWEIVSDQNTDLVSKEEFFAFAEIARHFRQIAEIEKVHAERFERFAKYMRENKLFVSDVETGWMCLNCGYVVTAQRPPEQCPVCKHEQGYFVRMEMVPWQMKK